MRRAIIKDAIARACPSAVTPEQIERAAAYIESHPEAAAAFAPFVREDEEVRICRGIG